MNSPRLQCTLFFVLRWAPRVLSSSSSHPTFVGPPVPLLSIRRRCFAARPIVGSIRAASASSEPSVSPEELPEESRRQRDDDTRLSVMPLSEPKLAFIGAGMMASAMINGIIAAKVCCRGSVYATTTSLEQHGISRAESLSLGHHGHGQEHL